VAHVKFLTQNWAASCENFTMLAEAGALAPASLKCAAAAHAAACYAALGETTTRDHDQDDDDDDGCGGGGGGWGQQPLGDERSNSIARWLRRAISFSTNSAEDSFIVRRANALLGRAQMLNQETSSPTVDFGVGLDLWPIELLYMHHTWSIAKMDAGWHCALLEMLDAMPTASIARRCTDAVEGKLHHHVVDEEEVDEPFTARQVDATIQWLFLRGLILRRLGRIESAVRMFSAVLKVDAKTRRRRKCRHSDVAKPKTSFWTTHATYQLALLIYQFRPADDTLEVSLVLLQGIQNAKGCEYNCKRRIDRLILELSRRRET
jgi:hypothetical protein